ncbi:MAG: hypothetical protein HDR05_04415 [Lachnospiraceae bacterium]|nr:hypothetical protein [Lachnospiraceae bacterium]
MNEIIVRNDVKNREPMSFERFKFVCYFVAGIVAEVLGFGLAFVIVLAMAGVFR